MTQTVRRFSAAGPRTGDLRVTAPMSDDEDVFDEWIRALDEDVIQGEYGYERGEFTVFPSRWRALYDEGLTPTEAWQRALST